MLKVRLITSLILFVVIGLCLFYGPPQAWTLFCTVLLACAAFEWTRFANYARVTQSIYIILTLIIACFLLVYGDRQFILWQYYIAAFFWCVIAPLWLVYKWRLSAHPWMAAGCGWVMLLPAFDILYQARISFMITLKLLSIIIIVWIADIAAYFIGRAFGQHKLALYISPGKSWEGVAGAMIAVGLYAVFLSYVGLAPIQPLSLWIGIAWILTAIGIVGDLLESLFKRQIGIKDSSHLLPGHGGVLDRLDSLLALLPFAGILIIGS